MYKELGGGASLTDLDTILGHFLAGPGCPLMLTKSSNDAIRTFLEFLYNCLIDYKTLSTSDPNRISYKDSKSIEKAGYKIESVI